MPKPQVQAFFERVTGTVTYLVHAGKGTPCAVIDAVLDYDAKSGRTRTTSASHVADAIRSQRLQLKWILETHAHADHLSAAPWLQAECGGHIAIGREITASQVVFKRVFHLEPEFATDGSQFDHLIDDDEQLSIGDLALTAWHVPGHTPACMAYLVDDAVFVGDTLFMPDVGSARCDFPGGSAQALYRSIQRILSLPPETRLFMCHDYPPAGREPQWETTVRAQRAANIHLRDDVSEEAFVALRTARDRTLDKPNLLLPAVQVNIRAGHLPPAEANGVSYLKIPVNLL